MRVVVTGATSFIGAATIAAMQKRGWQVYGVVRPDSTKLSKFQSLKGLKIIACDLTQLDRLPELISEPCDCFLHFGWQGSGSEARKDVGQQQQNVACTLKAVEAARQLSCSRFLFSGSQAEYGMHHTTMTEQAPCVPLSAYGLAKLEVCSLAAQACQSYGMDYGHIRIFSLYGPGDHAWSLVSSCIRTFLKGDEIELGRCESRWNFLYIEDGAEAFCRFADFSGSLTQAGTVFNLAGDRDETATLRFFVETMYDRCGRMGNYVYGVRPANAEGEIELLPDIGRLKGVLGWKPEISFDQGIDRTIKAVAKWTKDV